MTKYLIAGDWHGNHIWAKKVIECAEKYNIDKIIQVGDFGVWPGREGQEYLYIVNRHLVKWNVKLYFLPGNHEDWNQLDIWSKEGPMTEEGFVHILDNIYYTGKVNSWYWDNRKFAVVGGATSIDRKLRVPQKSWWPQESLKYDEMLKAQKIGKVDYLFTHDTSDQHPFDWLMYDIESAAHREYMTHVGKALMPYVWFHGHYHCYAEYGFRHSKGYSAVYSLDADDMSCFNRSEAMFNHVVILDGSTGEVTRV